MHFYYFDKTYYLQSKLTALQAAGGPTASGGAWTTDSLLAAIAASGMTPQSHYEAYGRSEGLSPNAYFNEYEYMQSKLRQMQSLEPNAGWNMKKLEQAFAEAGLIPADHYALYGWKEFDKEGNFLNPSNGFDANGYWSAKLLQLRQTAPDDDWNATKMLEAFEDANLDPISHYMLYGAAEARSQGVAFLQTVPDAQRVTSDPFRAQLGQEVPANNESKTPEPEDPKEDVQPDDEDMVEDVLDFIASTGVDRVTFRDGAGESFSTTFGTEASAGTLEKVSLDFADIAMKEGDGLLINNLLAYTHEGANESGAALAALVADSVVTGWDLAVDGTKLNFTAATTGDKPDLTAKFYDSGVAEVQVLDLADVVLLPDARINIGYFHFLNTTGNALSGADLAAALGGKSFLYGDATGSWSTANEPGETTVAFTSYARFDHFPLRISQYTPAASNVYTMDLSGVTLNSIDSGEEIQFLVTRADGSVTAFWANNYTDHPLSGADLADFFVSTFFKDDEYCFQAMAVQDGKLVLTLHPHFSVGQDAPSVLSAAIPDFTSERQYIDVSRNVVVQPGESITVGGVDIFTNYSERPLSGDDLVAYIAYDKGFDGDPEGWVASCDTSGFFWFRAITAGDKELLTASYGTANRQLTVRTFSEGTDGALTPVPVDLVSEGRDDSLVELSTTELVKGVAHSSDALVVVEDVKGVPSSARTLPHSSLDELDSLIGFNPAEDRIILPEAVSALVKGVLSGVAAEDFSGIAGSGEGMVGAGEAGLFKHANDYYVFVNDANASFNAETDVVIKLVGFTDAQAEAMTVEVFAAA